MKKREILFRGRCVIRGEWVSSMTVCKGIIKRKRDNFYIEDALGRWAHVEKETISQYTGLNDKNGKQIFEGDILSPTEKDHNYVVKWPVAKACELHSKTDIAGGIRFLFNYNKSIEVIGNIHDNPELLKS